LWTQLKLCVLSGERAKLQCCAASGHKNDRSQGRVPVSCTMNSQRAQHGRNDESQSPPHHELTAGTAWAQEAEFVEQLIFVCSAAQADKLCTTADCSGSFQHESAYSGLTLEQQQIICCCCTFASAPAQCSPSTMVCWSATVPVRCMAGLWHDIQYSQHTSCRTSSTSSIVGGFWTALLPIVA
jgi:hypothetical protein